MTNYAQFTTPEAFNEWLDEQEDRDDALDEAWAAYFEEDDKPADQRSSWRWLIPAVDPDRATFQFPDELHEQKWLLTDEDGELLEDQPSEHQEINAFILEVFKDFTGLDGSITGDTRFDYDDDGRITAVDAGVVHAVPEGYEHAVTFLIQIDWDDEDEQLVFTYDEVASLS